MKLKIYADKAYLPPKERYVMLLFPFWGLIPEPAGDKDAGRFDEYAKHGKQFFELVPSLADADVAVLPFEWRPGNSAYIDLAMRLADEAEKNGKRVVVFFNSDSDEAISLDNAVIFRTSFYRSTRGPFEFAFPGWSVDFVPRYLDGKLSVRKKDAYPVVAYCGYVDFDYRSPKSLLLHGLRVLSGRPLNIGASLRGRAVRTLRQDHRIRLNFVGRTGFKGGSGESDRFEYVRNMVEADYALVTRGAGNFSYRLYEVLSCGRIPVFIDTDCVLPFDHLIDWKRYCVWIDVDDIDSIADAIMEFHNSMSDKEFEELQRSIRSLYETWISPVGFYGNLWRCLKQDASVE